MVLVLGIGPLRREVDFKLSPPLYGPDRHDIRTQGFPDGQKQSNGGDLSFSHYFSMIGAPAS